jgi:hypothetical protein
VLPSTRSALATRSKGPLAVSTTSQRSARGIAVARGRRWRPRACRLGESSRRINYWTGDSHPDRDAQFGYINTKIILVLAEQQPVTSVDTKKRD